MADLNVKDDEWARRLRKRVRIVGIIVDSVPFRAALAAHWLSEELTFPHPPCPADRTLSKRHWESKMMRWRSQIEVFLLAQPEAGLRALAGSITF